MIDIFTGIDGKQYTLTSHIKSGGEGSVYNIDQPDLVAKIYNTSKVNIDARLSELEQKIKFMVNNRIPTKFPDGTVIVTWPQDILYKDGKFVGYIMPKISGAKPFYMISRGGSSANSVIPGYNWKIALKVASNLAYIVSFLHSKGVVIGDMNSDNLLVYPNGLVVIIDTDSFDLRDQTMDRHYKCCVGIEEFLPPELQGRNLERESAQYTEYSDDFALAIHIFQLLMNNVHPFNARVITDYKQSVPENNQNHNISVGNCPFIGKIAGCETPLGSPVMDELLPDYLIDDFKKTFAYHLDLSDPGYADKLKVCMKNRTTASEWHRDLKRLSNDPNLVQCSANRAHFYLSSKAHCEMCAAEERIKKSVQYPNNVNSNVNGAKVSSSGTSNGGNATSNTAVNNVSNHNSSGSNNKKKGRFKYLIVAALLVIVCVAYSPVKNYINYSSYTSAVNAYYDENYDEAAEKFAELGDYKDSYENWINSMVAYVNSHYDNTDRTTYRYMRNLIATGAVSEDEYDKLYSWRLESKMINYEYDDHDTDRSSISSIDMWYAHFEIVGGTPGETLEVYTVCKQGSGSHDINDYEADGNNYVATNECWIDDGPWYFTDSSDVGNGKWTMAVFEKENNKCLGYVSVRYREF